MEEDENSTSVRIVVVGNVDSGKSTLIGVLTKGEVDDGRGCARLKIFNFPHEVQNGRTSSVAQEIMGFDEKGDQVLPNRFNQNKNKYWAEVVQKSKRVQSLVDLCGHEKYLKTTMYGMVSMYPDYSMVIIGANDGSTINRMTKEHIGISMALKIPFFIVITKVDFVPKEILNETMKTVKKLLNVQSVKRNPYFIEDNQDIEKCQEGLFEDVLCPIFKVSSVSGEGLSELISFIRGLKSRLYQNPSFGTVHDPVEFYVQDKFVVQGIGLCVNGVLVAGTVTLGQTLLLGPDNFSQYRSVVVRSIHVYRQAENTVSRPQCATFNIKAVNNNNPITRKDFRNGMCLIDQKLNPKPIIEFDAEIIVLHHATTIQLGYQAVLHCGVIRQCISIESMDKEIIRTKEKATIRCKFLYKPEYLKPNLEFMLREGRTKVLGKVLVVYAK